MVSPKRTLYPERLETRSELQFLGEFSATAAIVLHVCPAIERIPTQPASGLRHGPTEKAGNHRLLA